MAKNNKPEDNQGGNSTKKVRKTKKKVKISHIVKPEKMSLEEWQIKLRKQVTDIEHFNISCVDDDLFPGEYIVRNPEKNNEYKVVYRGANSEWNYCSCMDFKTSRLGTCKHIEAVKKWFGGKKGVHVHRELPPYTSVYLSYRDERCVKIRIGSDNKEAYEQLAKDYFDENHVLKKSAYTRIGSFLKQARQISDTFRCYKDAIDFIIDIREKAKRENIVKTYDDEKLDNLLKVNLYPYQKEGIRFAAKAGKAIIADEMGLGKTIQAIGTAELLRKEGLIGSVLVLCPTSLKYQWRSEIKKFTDAEVFVIEGSHLKRKEAYNRPEPYKIISYNSAANDIKILGSLQTDMLIMDEVQRLKNWNTQISRAARKIEADYSVILSGTPLENKLDELYSIVEFVDNFRLAPYYLFKDKHIITDETGKVLGYKNLNDIGKKLSDILIRRRKKDVKLQMPERSDKNLFIPMTNEQKDMHQEWQNQVRLLVLKWRKMHFLSDKDRKRLLLFLSQMRMVCDSSYILDQKTRYDTKVDECVNIISDIISEEGEKVVVFSQWERMTRLIAKELEKKEIGFEYLHGGVPSEKRKNLVDNFMNEPSSRVFLSTDAGSTGLNLQSAATIINIDLPWNPAVLEQRIGRIYRLGQQNNIQVINLVTPYSIEEEMLGKLRFKTSMFEGVLDDGEDSVFITDDKFSKMMETVSGMVEENEKTEKVKDADSNNIKDSEGQTETPKVEEDFTTINPKELETDKSRNEHKSDENKEDISIQQHTSSSLNRESVSNRSNQPKDLVAQGVSFLSGLAETLKSPEATAQLVDSIIEKDEETGETSIKIPVESKETVSNLLNLIGKLFAK
ncbi:MAG TPA: ATP-dependent helicase [Prevotella sp.]|nr:DEAD/DEAH box helicase [Prevotella sp.]HCD65468.1 ATP-dependent helicase [Prevotella sp.]